MPQVAYGTCRSDGTVRSQQPSTRKAAADDGARHEWALASSELSSATRRVLLMTMLCGAVVAMTTTGRGTSRFTRASIDPLAGGAQTATATAAAAAPAPSDEAPWPLLAAAAPFDDDDDDEMAGALDPTPSVLSVAASDGAAVTAAAASASSASSCACARSPPAYEVNNEWTQALGLPIGRAYPWVGDDGWVLDAHHEATFHAPAASDECAYAWTIDGEAKSWTPSWTFSLGMPTDHVVALTASCVVVDDDGASAASAEGERAAAAASASATVTATARFTLKVRYVRREVRELMQVPGGLERFLDAVEIMWNTSIADGRAKFGRKFINQQHLATLHIAFAGTRDSDHLHEGHGFLANHVKISRVFEESLQAIDKRLTLPYHDLTIETQQVVDGALGSVWDSVMWSEKVYGSIANQVNNSDSKQGTQLEYWRDAVGFLRANETVMRKYAIPDGRFAGLKLPPPMPGTMTNPYGYMRSPWNPNPSPYVTRFAMSSGYAVQCTAIEDAIEPLIDEFAEWMFWSEFTVHGNIHSVTAGELNIGVEPVNLAMQTMISKCCGGTDELGDNLASDRGSITGTGTSSLYRKYGMKNKNCSNLQYEYLKEHKALWREYRVDYPSVCTPSDAEDDAVAGSSCRQFCTKAPEEVALTLLQWTFFDYTNTEILAEDFMGCASKETLKEIGEIFCANTPTYVLGDHDHGADPSFYAIHPAVERVYQMAVLNGATTPSEFERKCVSQVRCYGVGGVRREGVDACCEGHGPTDRWHINLTHAEAARMTISELLALADPRDVSDGQITYPIFHHFHFDHCNFTNITAYQQLLDKADFTRSFDKHAASSTTTRWSSTAASLASQEIELSARDPGHYMADDNDTMCIEDDRLADFVFYLEQFMGYKKEVAPGGGAIFTDRGMFALWHENNTTTDPLDWGYKLSNNYIALLEACVNSQNYSDCMPTSDFGSYATAVDMGDCSDDIKNSTIQLNVSCVESCVESRYAGSVLADSPFPSITSCSDPINVAFLFAPNLMKSCFDSTVNCAETSPPCASGCYDCITDCITYPERTDQTSNVCMMKK